MAASLLPASAGGGIGPNFLPQPEGSGGVPALVGFADYGLDPSDEVQILVNRGEEQLGTKIARLSVRWALGMTTLDSTEEQMVSQADELMTNEVVLYTLSADQGQDIPDTPQELSEFSQWVQSLAVHPSARFIEAWNEPDYRLFNDPRDKNGNPVPIAQRAKDYGLLQIAAYRAIHQVRPDAVVIAGSLAHDSETFMKYLTPVVQGQKDADALSFHYPSSAKDYLRRAKILRRAFGNLPIWITEDGSNLPNPIDRANDTRRKIMLANEMGAKALVILQIQNRKNLPLWRTGAYDDDWQMLPTGTVIKEMATANPGDINK